MDIQIKRDKSGKIERFKARLVVRGYEQREGIDFEETYSPVATISSIRTIIAIATIKNLEWIQFDVASAFLNGVIEEDIYAEPPEGLTTNKCLKLNKALY